MVQQTVILKVGLLMTNLTLMVDFGRLV